MNAIPVLPPHPRPCRQIFIFGNGDMGQFGLGTTVMGEISRPRLHAWFESVIPTGILGGEGAGVAKIAAGGLHTLAIDEDGKVWSWGVNDNAALGRQTVGVADPDSPGDILESDILETQPAIVQSLVDEAFQAVDIAAGDSVTVALGSTGQLRVWGSFRSSEGLLGFSHSASAPPMQLTPSAIPYLEGRVFAQVACGTDHVIALTTNGTVYVWGNGQQAQLGRRIIERRKLNGLYPERLALRRIQLVAAGSYHSFAVSQTGVVYAWGLNNMRQTGISDEMGGNNEIIWNPTEVSTLHPDTLGQGRRVVQISGGEHHTLFLLNNGSVYGCGRCDGHELGLGDDHPMMTTLREAATASNSKMLISEPTLIPISSPEMDRVPIRQVSVGIRQNLAVSQDGHVYSWGTGPSCELGLGQDVEVQQAPKRIVCRALEGWVVEGATAGGQHCVLMARRPA